MGLFCLSRSPGLPETLADDFNLRMCPLGNPCDLKTEGENMSLWIFDTHAHYDASAFDKDRDALIDSLKQNGIGKVVNVSAAAKDVDQVINLTQKYDFIYGTVGLHPDEVGDLTDELMEEFEELLKLPKIVAVGEIGLDYYWNKEVKEMQKECFVRQIDLARRTGKPLVIHSREAAGDTLDIMRSENAGDIGGIVHCYSYSPELAREYVKMGYYIGVGGVVTFKNAKKLVQTVSETPMECILLETDSPYLTPEPHRGHRNDSRELIYVVEKIAEIKGMTPEEVEDITWKNASCLFRL